MAFNLNATFQGLNTLLVGVPTAGPYKCAGSLTLPNIQEGDPSDSQCVVTITQTPSGGGPTTIYTGLPGAMGFAVTVNAAALDSIAITLSSSATIDQGLNVIKCTASIG